MKLLILICSFVINQDFFCFKLLKILFVLSKFLFFVFLIFFNLNFFSQSNSNKIKLTQEELQWIKNNPKVYFGYDPNWPPYEIYENGNYLGICSEYMKLISKRTGLNFVPSENETWETSFDKLKKSEILMVPGAGITEERKKYLIYTDNYIRLPWVIVCKKNNKSITKISDLNGKTISIPTDYLQQDVLRKEYPKINIISRKDYGECLNDVSSGISIASIGSLGAVSFAINQTNSYDLDICAFTDRVDYVAFAFPKEQIILRNIVQKGLKSVQKDEKNKINAKWVTINYKNDSSNKELWKYFSLSILILIILFVIFYSWNKSLRKQIHLRKNIELELSSTLDKVNKQNNDKTILLQEIHHRVKNNLQIIISLLRLQSNTHTNKDVQDALNEAIERINSISLVHEHIYKNPNLGEFDLEQYILNLGQELKRIFIKDLEINIHVQMKEINIDLKPIVPIALILNELFSNSFKYAFREKQVSIPGNIWIEMELTNNQLVLKYEDDGEWFNNSYTRNFGTYLIEIFTEQLNGEFTLSKELRTSYLFVFKDFN